MSNDDDQESGKGHSLPQSPLRDSYSILGDVQISLCGFQLNPNAATPTLMLPSSEPPTTTIVSCEYEASFEDLFQQHIVPFERFMEEITNITTNPNLVIKINNRYMNWASASPIILSAILYQKNLPTDTVNMVLDTHMPKTGAEIKTTSTASITKTTTKIVKKENKQEKPVTTTTATANTNASEQKRSGWGKMFWGGSSSNINKKPVDLTNMLTATTTTTTMTTTTTTLTLAAQNSSSLMSDELGDEDLLGSNSSHNRIKSTSTGQLATAGTFDEIEKTMMSNDDSGPSVTFDMDPPLSSSASTDASSSLTNLTLKKSHSSTETLGYY